LCTDSGFLGLAARGGRDLLGTLPRALENALRLLTDFLERVFDGGFRRATGLELCHHLPHAAHIAVDGFAVVPAHRNRKGDVF
jgi:hypothetical protein